MSFAVGSLVRARGREWVVQPGSDEETLLLRPLGGTDDELTGIYLPLEPAETAVLPPPDPTRAGDPRSARLLRDAIRLGFRSSAGPFRSFGRIAVDPRPYQLIPLLMALKLDTVRLLIADDVGIGKTIEAAMVARELMDQGEVARLAVICPPHLAEQWHEELLSKFHIDAALVLPGTTARLERRLKLGQSLFEIFPHVIVSVDYIKSALRRADFVKNCPELVIVDEAHTCAANGTGRTQQQRHELIKEVAVDSDRHLILVTATPHSGNEEAFRSLLTLLRPDFADLPEDLAGRANEIHRKRLARHFVQRTRADIKSYLDTETPFPERIDEETTYRLTPEYKKLFDRVLRFARERVRDSSGEEQRHRIRWWAVLGLLRSLGSSPAAAAAALRSRAAVEEATSVDEIEEIGRRSVFDLVSSDSGEEFETVPGVDIGEDDDAAGSRKRLLKFAREADQLRGEKDAKLVGLVKLLKALLDEHRNPIVFCRFIATAEYLAEELRRRIPRDVEVEAVTGLLAPEERELRIAGLVSDGAGRRILIATDCLSEGINLQSGFDSVVHYDLAWNPTRHEQRAGRVDRFGQVVPEVKVVTYYGIDNQIDGIILRVLLRKHQTIRHSLGISVPMPTDAETVTQAILEGLLLKEDAGIEAVRLPGFDDYFAPIDAELDRTWTAAANREKRSRTMFAQQGIKVDEVARELAEARNALGSPEDVKAFVVEVLNAEGALVSSNGRIEADLSNASWALRDVLGKARFKARFVPAVIPGELYISRTHPIVEGLSSYVTASALDPSGDRIAARCGAAELDELGRNTFLVLLRIRFRVLRRKSGQAQPILAEECRMLAFEGSSDRPTWLPSAEIDRLLSSSSVHPVPVDTATQLLVPVLNDLRSLEPFFAQEVDQRKAALLEAHRRVRSEAKAHGVTYEVDAFLPPDLLGIYGYLPVGGG